jgi:hypothetical protein
MTSERAYSILKENCRKADALGHRRNARIPIAVVAHRDGYTVAYVA